MIKKLMEQSIMDTVATTTTTLKSKKFPTMFKKMMLSRLKNISKDATSAVKSSVQKKTSAKKKLTTATTVVAPVEGKRETAVAAARGKPTRPGTAALDEPPSLPDNRERTVGGGTETRPPTSKRPVAQQFNTRTYRVKTKDRKSVLSLPEVSKQAAVKHHRKSYLPVKVKAPAPAPPTRKRNQSASPPSNDLLQRSNNYVTATEVDECETAPDGYRPEKWVPTAVASARKKRLVLCYLCGKEFGTASLPFHEPQCLKKWTQENSRLPERLQRAMPQKPEIQNLSVDDWNQLAWEATQSNLVPCDYCQRKFLANRLDAHAKVCIESKKKPAVPVSKLPVKLIMEKPQKRPMPCYICGRMFGTASIGIHEPQCLIKWTRENDELPPHLRRPVPTKPEVIINKVTGKIDEEATTEEQWKSHLAQLVQCDRCNRTFAPDRLKVHQRSCKGVSTKK